MCGKQPLLCAEGWAPMEEQVIRHILGDCVGNGLCSSLIIKGANQRDVANAVPLTHFRSRTS